MNDVPRPNTRAALEEEAYAGVDAIVRSEQLKYCPVSSTTRTRWE